MHCELLQLQDISGDDKEGEDPKIDEKEGEFHASPADDSAKEDNK